MKKLIYVSLCVLALSNCTKKNTTTIVESPATGTISGNTEQYNQYGELLKTGLNNVTVTLDNDPASTTTDEYGNYTLSGIKPGVYSISFSKPGCTTYKLQQVTFPGNGTLYKNGFAIENPTYTLLNASITLDTTHTQNSNQVITIKGNITPSTKPVNVTVFISTNPDLTNNTSGNFTRVISIPANTSSFTNTFGYPIYDWSTNIYAKLYASNVYTFSYHEFTTNSNVLLGYGNSLATVKLK